MNLMRFPKDEKYDRARHLAEPLTPKSERNVAGHIFAAVPNMGCPAPRCLLRKGHPKDHWPR